MKREELLSAVREEITGELPLDGHVLREEDVLTGLPGSGSVHLLRVAAGLERRFGVEFEDERLFSAKTVGDLVDLLAGALPVGGAS
ncbi:acyl carrier protein [Umezawaea beigongshangensis]|uniref:acyl carrier protein n=1 Tax=Umezawaea beigongshangensis TaxID=2780383 RepID=UPI0018F1CE69|nr:acyl carrier protein [Umezawaea beigongshangensis]